MCCVSQDSSALEDLQTDAGACIKELLYTESDLTVTPLMDNPKVSTKLKAVRGFKISTIRKAELQLFVVFSQILKNAPVRFDSKILCVSAYSGKLCCCHFC